VNSFDIRVFCSGRSRSTISPARSRPVRRLGHPHRVLGGRIRIGGDTRQIHLKTKEFPQLYLVLTDVPPLSKGLGQAALGTR